MRHRAQGSLLGDNSTTSSPKPVGVLNLGKAVAVTVAAHSCAVTAKKAVECWGYNASGQVGNNTTATAPQPVKLCGY